MVKQALEIRQSQSLVMTRQLLQSIELLPLSALELQELVAAELEKNPLLSTIEETAAAKEIRDDNSQASKIDMEEATMWGSEPSDLKRDELRYANVGNSASGDYFDIVEQTIADSKSLHQSLREQMQSKKLSAIELKMAEILIDMVDGAGYLPLDYQLRTKIAGIPDEQLTKLIAYLHECEPTGVGARNLQECLQLQLRERGELCEIMQILLANLQLVAEGSEKKLAKLCEVNDISAYLARLRNCNPKPASDYGASEAQTLIPDVLVRRGSKTWEVELNPDILPKIAVDMGYSEQLFAKLRDKEDSKIINEHLSNANWLLKSLHQRNQTLLNVARAIITRQQDFLEYGVFYLNPMTLRDVADDAGCHESTVSRVTTQKYMATERGIFELKYFFSSNLQNNNGGGGYSSRSVMHLIEQLVKSEAAKGKVLSDEAIADDLQKQGIEVARRTIVKYRKQLGIAPSNERKKALKS